MKAFCHRNEINAAYKSNLKTTKNVPLPPPFSNPSLMFYMKIAFIFLGMEELVVPGIKHTKINTSVIICTLSSVFKIHAGWDVLNLEMHALCWWWSRPNRNFRCSPDIIFCSSHLTHSHCLPTQSSRHCACHLDVTLLVVTGFSGTLTSTACEAQNCACHVASAGYWCVNGSTRSLWVSRWGWVGDCGLQGPFREDWSLF